MRCKKDLELLRKVFLGEYDENNVPTMSDIETALKNIEKSLQDSQSELTFEILEKIYASKKSRLLLTADFLKEVGKEVCVKK